MAASIRSSTVASTRSDSTCTRGVISSSAVAVAEPQRPVQQRRGARVEGAVLGAGAHQRAQLLRRPRGPQFLGRFNAEPAHDPVRGAVQRVDQPAEHHREPGLEPGDRARRGQRAGDGEVLRARARRTPPTAWSPAAARSRSRSPRPTLCGQRRPRPAAASSSSAIAGSARKPSDQRGQRDAELGAGQLERQRAVCLLHGARPPCRRPAATLVSTWLRSRVVREYSAATKIAFASVSTSTASRKRTSRRYPVIAGSRSGPGRYRSRGFPPARYCGQVTARQARKLSLLRW